MISFAIGGHGLPLRRPLLRRIRRMIPVAGSAYTYTYATMGRLMAWIIGWNLVLEYLAAGSTVRGRLVGLFQRLHGQADAHADPGRVRRAAPFKLEGFHNLVADRRLFQPAGRRSRGSGHLRADRRRESERELQQPDGRGQTHHRPRRDLRLLLAGRARQPRAVHPDNTGTFGKFRLDRRIPRHRRDLLRLYRLRRGQRCGTGGA